MSQDGAANVLTQDLERFVKGEALEWGDNVADNYFSPAEKDADWQWDYVQQFLAPHRIDYTNTMELSCGRGRNTAKLIPLAKSLTLVDVNPDNIAFCKKRYAGKPLKYVLNNGYDLRGIPTASTTFIYCFEAAVHFDLEIILAYIKDFRRVLASGAAAFVHHSNVTSDPGLDFRKRPGWRNFMSKDIFAHLSIHNGLEVVAQHVFDWGGPQADCFSLVRKPL